MPIDVAIAVKGRCTEGCRICCYNPRDRPCAMTALQPLAFTMVMLAILLLSEFWIDQCSEELSRVDVSAISIPPSERVPLPAGHFYEIGDALEYCRYHGSEAWVHVSGGSPLMVSTCDRRKTRTESPAHGDRVTVVR